MTLTRWAMIAAGTLVVGGMFYLANPLFPVWQFMWFAPALVLAMAYRLDALFAALVAIVAWLIGQSAQWHYLGVLHADGLPAWQILEEVAMPGLALSAAALLSRALARRGALLLATIAFPALWVSYEYLNAVLSPNSTFGDIAYTQMDVLPLLQIASVTGLLGVSFAVMLGAAALAALSHGGPLHQRLAASGLAALVIVCVLAFGVWRLSEPVQGLNLIAGAVVTDRSAKSFAHAGGDSTLVYLDTYIDEIHRAALRGAQAVVLPENLVRATNSNVGVIMGQLSNEARRDHITLVSGVHRIEAVRTLNQAVAFSPDGKLLTTYTKVHNFPGAGDVPGTSPGIWALAGSDPWGVEICKDMDFPALSRAYGKDGVGVMFVPASDYGAHLEGPMHGRMAMMRAIENGFSLVRGARHGFLSISDDKGRVLAQSASDNAAFPTIVARVSIEHEKTYYTRFGDWFAYAAMTLTFFAFIRLLILSIVRLGRHAKTDNSQRLGFGAG